LEKAFVSCRREKTFDLERDKVVIFSDHHKGTRDGADDFWVAERAYNAALGYYLEAGHTLVVLGDGEELWENASAEEVFRCYRETFDLECDFHADDRYWRFFGNHDIRWKRRGLLAEQLAVQDLEVLESLKLRVIRGDATEGLLFLVHGHQGTLFSDTLAALGAPAVRHIWGPWQRLKKRSLNTPARNYNLREHHETAMMNWAKRRRAPNEGQPVLISGHTHRPVFGERTQPWPSRPEALREELEAARQSEERSSEVPGLRAKLEHARAAVDYYDDPEPVDPPCFFNTGCCSFSDGDVTGVELAAGEIRLVRWSKFSGQAEPEVLQCLPLFDVLRAVNAGVRLDPSVACAHTPSDSD